jgi:hypothetical protein
VSARGELGVKAGARQADHAAVSPRSALGLRLGTVQAASLAAACLAAQAHGVGVQRVAEGAMPAHVVVDLG